MYSISTGSKPYFLDLNNIQSTETQIPTKHQQYHKDSFITKLEPHYFPTEPQKEPMALLINKLKTTDSISESNALSDQIKDISKQLAKDIQMMRSTCFTVENDDDDDVYGRLSDGYTKMDRDNYIRALIQYHQYDDQLKSLKNGSSFSIKNELAPSHVSVAYGDWEALNSLLNGGTAKLPNLTHNRGSTVS